MWDLDYYDHCVRADDHDVDVNEVAAYLPLEAIFIGLLTLSADVFGLRYEESGAPHAWHPDVRLFAVLDRTSGAELGWFYADLHPRPGKYGDDMAEPLRLPRLGRDGRRESGVAAMVMNLPAPTQSGPARLQHEDMVVLFHEFGHVLHELLGTNAYHGTSMVFVEDDFVETPSQVMENWAWDPETLVRISRHAETGAAMPRALAERVAASRGVNRASRELTYLAGNSAFDQRVHGPSEADLDDAMLASDSLRGLPTVNGTFWPASFTHLVGGYDAGYYGYLWSLVLACDLWSRFAEDVFSPGVGASYREYVLEAGASRDAAHLAASFLGRQSTNDAFFHLLGIVGFGG